MKQEVPGITMMNKSKFFPEYALYSLAFLAALGIRLASLGQSFLTNPEAGWALQALHLAQGTHPEIGAQPGLVLLTGSLFFLFGSSAFIARLAPAVVGSLLAFSPLLFRNRLGKPATIILAFALAFDPGLVAMSRQVDGHILALAFTVFGLGFLNDRKPAGFGIFLGLAFLVGTPVWLGWAALLLAGLIFLVLRPKHPKTAGILDVETELELPEYSGIFKKSMIWLAGTVFFAGTLFFMEPKALSGAGTGLVTFFTGFSGMNGVPFSQILAGLFFYEPFPLILAVFASIRSLINKKRADQFLALAWLISLILVSAYPGRQVGDLIWVDVPMWALTASLLAQVFGSKLPKKLEFSEAVLTIVLLVSAWLNFIAAMSSQFADATGHWVLIVFMAFFLGAAVILLTWGWSWKIAMRGVGLGFCSLLVIFTLSAAFKAAGQGPRPEQELWLTGPDFKEADLLVKTAGDYSLWNTNNPTALDLTVVNGSPALQWLFRNFTKTDFEDNLPADAAPSMVVTPEQATLSLPGQYTGQSFVTELAPTWSKLTASDWIKWMIFRQAPLEKTTVVLWVKSDLFPGSIDFNLKRTP